MKSRFVIGLGWGALVVGIGAACTGTGAAGPDSPSVLPAPSSVWWSPASAALSENGGAGGTTPDATPPSSPSPSSSSSVTASVVDHHAVRQYDSIPDEVLGRAARLQIFYGRTSHGSQLERGARTLGHTLSNLHSTTPDLGTSTWHTQTDEYLAAHPNTNVVMWSWCGQQASNSEATVRAYLENMSALEAKYPNVHFIYMTGHLRGAYHEYQYSQAQNRVLQRNNQMVRDYCKQNSKWLYDFADIESYLDGTEEQCRYDGMPVECEWPTNESGCAHSRMPNCLRKGKALMTLLARITGFSG